MNYIVLFSRLRQYEDLRFNRDKELSDSFEQQIQSKEFCIYLISMLLILAFPISIAIQCAFYADGFDGDVIEYYHSFQLQFTIQFFLIAVGLAVATYASIMQMRRVFGAVNLDEERIIKFTLIVFCASYMVRVICETLIFAYQEKVESIYQEQVGTYTSIVLGCWFLWDFLPLVSMLVIHYKSFSSF